MRPGLWEAALTHGHRLGDVESMGGVQRVRKGEPFRSMRQRAPFPCVPSVAGNTSKEASALDVPEGGAVAPLCVMGSPLSNELLRGQSPGGARVRDPNGRRLGCLPLRGVEDGRAPWRKRSRNA